jgi:hypothetical protein
MAAVLVAVLAILILLVLFVKDANGNFVYWANDNQTSIGRAKVNGAGANNNFITGVDGVHGVAVDSRFIYWTRLSSGTSSIGRANLDGSGVNHQFIATNVTSPVGIAVTPSSIYWTNEVGMGGTSIGRANIDGTNADPNFITSSVDTCGLAADSSFLYFFGGDGLHIGRAQLSGAGPDPNFIAIPDPFCGLAVDPSFIYWGADGTNSVGRVPVGGGTPNATFVPAGTTSGAPSGIAVNSQYLFWSNADAPAIGRANINGSSPNQALVTAVTNPGLMAAAPSNKITVNSITRKKRKGTAVINAKVPGPGQVTLSQTPGGEDPNATEAAVKRVGLTITGASSFKLPIKPKGKTKKKLNKQVKRKGRGKAKVKAFITFVPAGVAGVPNTRVVQTKLIKKRKRKK